MIDFTATLSREYDARLDREDADARETAQRAQQLTDEMIGVLLSGNGAVRYLNSAGHQTTMNATECMECYSMPEDVLAILREVESSVGVPNALRIRVGALFASAARAFAEIAAENAR